MKFLNISLETLKKLKIGQVLLFPYSTKLFFKSYTWTCHIADVIYL